VALPYDEREGGELRGSDPTTASAATRPSIPPRRVRKLRNGCSKTPEYAGAAEVIVICLFVGWGGLTTYAGIRGRRRVASSPPR
jgi:hypothetical protein